MTNAPKRIWVEMPEIIDAMGFWQEQEYPGLLPYITEAASDARVEAAVVAGLQAAAKWCADEATRCDDAARWGGSRRYVSDYVAAAYTLRNAYSKIMSAADPDAVARIAKEVTP